MRTTTQADVSRRSRGTSSLPNGRACTNCARIKCKCIYRSEEGPDCERCRRLKKECVALPVTAPRPAQRRVRGASRAARLEKKLDELVSVLRSQAAAPATTSDDDGDVDDDADGGDGDDEDAAADSIEVDGDQEMHLVEETGFIPYEETAKRPPESSLNTSPTIIVDDPTPLSGPGSSITFGSDELSLQEAQLCLNKFREETLAFFPFAYIPHHVTVADIRKFYPFLWLNILSTTTTSHERRINLGDQAKNIVIQKIVVEREKSIDLLLGLLTYLGWISKQRAAKQYTSLFSQLVVTLVYDLGLHRHPSENRPPFCVSNKPKDGNANSTQVIKRTPEEIRAVLGAFILTSMISWTFGRADGLRWSTQLDEHLNCLANESNVAQDRILVAQVRMQLIMEQIHPYSRQASPRTGLPTPYLDTLRSQLHRIASQAEGGSIGNQVMMVQLSSFIELLLYESAMTNPTEQRNEPDFQRFAVYQGCLNSVKAWLDSFFSMPTHLHASMPFTSFRQLTYTLCSLHNLSVLNDPAWDRAAVRKFLDLLPTCDRVISIFQYLKGSSAVKSPDWSGDESYSLAIRVLEKMRLTWQSEMATVEPANVAMLDSEVLYESQSLDNLVNFWISDPNNFWS
ncbi:hypothetical protein F5Y10DRAFT_279115 [Nemania abortiva]|nr:hypothetical protein F5Y10DRAFT_279115 [Nemania abortiva]